MAVNGNLFAGYCKNQVPARHYSVLDACSNSTNQSKSRKIGAFQAMPSRLRASCTADCLDVTSAQRALKSNKIWPAQGGSSRILFELD